MPSIGVQLPADRTQTGTLSLVADDGVTVIAGPFMVYGKADGQTAAANGNSTRNTLLPFGDTPLGTYSVPGMEVTGDGTGRSTHSYGPNGAIRLNPTGGDAATAAIAGRQYLLIHGGDPNAAGLLRPTNGCLRLSNPDMVSLINSVAVEAQLSGPPNSCNLGVLAVSVFGPGGVDDGYDEGDPPPPAAAMPIPAPIPLP
jgi:lipoprotein-anchoring transpeptidase ErfK/SrfK